MKIHEYQGEELFRKYGIPVCRGMLAATPEEAYNAAKTLKAPVVLKAQVHVGGRGKAGGVKLAETPEKASEVAGTILGMNIKGITVRKLLITEAVDISKEFYVGIAVDRNSQKIVFMVSADGGVEIEKTAEDHPERIVKVLIDPIVGFRSFQVRKLSRALFSGEEDRKTASSIFVKLYNLFISKDCSLAEINPLIQAETGEIIALDSKINFDDNALGKHPELADLIDPEEEDADELEAKKHGLSFVKLDGNIGCIVNGAGLAMATMDIIKLYGGEPANFLDVGGSSNPAKIIKAFELILKNKKIKAVLVNIFGGITRCDDIAEGLIQAGRSMDINVPVVIRLTGNNLDKANSILGEAGLSAYLNLKDAVTEVVKYTDNNRAFEG